MAALLSGLYLKLIFPTNVDSPGWLLLLHIIIVAAAAAGGYLINDVFDHAADQINKPSHTTLSKQNGMRGWAVLNLLALASSLVFARIAGSYALFLLTATTIALLFCYSRWWQRWTLLGNAVVALLCALVVLSVPLCASIPANPWALFHGHRFSLDFKVLAVLAFLVSLVREIIKDLEDREGDKAVGMATLAILSEPLARWLALICMLILTFVLTVYLFSQERSLGGAGHLWTCLLLLISLLLSVRIYQSRQKKTYQMLRPLVQSIHDNGDLTALVLDRKLVSKHGHVNP